MLPVIKTNSVWPVLRRNPFDVLDRLMGEFEPTMLREVERVGAIDVHEDDSHLYVEAELPGFQRDKIDVTLEDGVLQLHAERTEESVDSSDQSEQSAKENYYVRERRTGEWSRAIRLPVAVEEDQVEATFADGVLRIVLPKEASKKAHRIELK